MKLGNISQSIVPVPYFFMDQKTRPLETFQLYNKTDSDFYKRKKRSKVSKAFKNSNTQINFDEISTNSSKPLPNFSFKRQKSYYRDRDVLTTFYNFPNYNIFPCISMTLFFYIRFCFYFYIYQHYSHLQYRGNSLSSFCLNLDSFSDDKPVCIFLYLIQAIVSKRCEDYD